MGRHVAVGMAHKHADRYYVYWSVRDGRWHLEDTEIYFERVYTTRDAAVRALKDALRINGGTPIYETDSIEAAS